MMLDAELMRGKTGSDGVAISSISLQQIGNAEMYRRSCEGGRGQKKGSPSESKGG